ncbi:hypothetical protein HDV05_003543 [Chytridiales sp. JEL 0842]|nr:hypothetical protein HDV05_003543 [Chytridiales sp. JEL 0842]
MLTHSNSSLPPRIQLNAPILERCAVSPEGNLNLKGGWGKEFLVGNMCGGVEVGIVRGEIEEGVVGSETLESFKDDFKLLTASTPLSSSSTQKKLTPKKIQHPPTQKPEENPADSWTDPQTFDTLFPPASSSFSPAKGYTSHTAPSPLQAGLRSGGAKKDEKGKGYGVLKVK